MEDIFLILRDNGLLLLIGQYPNGPLGGLAITFIVSVLGITFAFPLGILMALALTSPIKWVRRPVLGIVYLLRGVPLVMLIFWVYFLVPLIIKQPISGVATMLITLVFYQASYLAEIIRAGIQGLPKGQNEAARACGLSYMQTMCKVILPQAIYNMIPSMISQFVSTIKETSLGYVISMNELTFAASQVNNILLTKPFQVFFILAMIYFTLCFSLTNLARYVEKRITLKRLGVRAPVEITPATSAQN